MSPDSPKILAPSSQASFPKPFHNLGALKIQVVPTCNTHLSAKNVSFHFLVSPDFFIRQKFRHLPNQHLLYFRLFHFPIPLLFQALGTHSSLTFCPLLSLLLSLFSINSVTHHFNLSLVNILNVPSPWPIHTTLQRCNYPLLALSGKY